MSISTKDLHKALKTFFGFDKFKGLQEQVIKSLLEQKNTFAIIFGNTKWFKEFTPMISSASICSVIRMVPISEAIFDPIFPAKIKLNCFLLFNCIKKVCGAFSTKTVTVF